MSKVYKFLLLYEAKVSNDCLGYQYSQLQNLHVLAWQSWRQAVGILKQLSKAGYTEFTNLEITLSVMHRFQPVPSATISLITYDSQAV